MKGIKLFLKIRAWVPHGFNLLMETFEGEEELPKV